MLFLGTFSIMKWRQLLCVAVCMVELAGCTAGSTTETPALTATVVTEDTSSGTASEASTATTASGDASTAKTTPAEGSASSVATSPSSPGPTGQLRTSPQPSPASTSLPGTSLEPQDSSPGVSTTQSPGTQPRDGAGTSGSPAGSSSAATSEHPSVSPATTTLHTARDSPQPPLPAITCHHSRDQGDTGAICLQLQATSNKSHSCEDFLERKGSDLWQAVCENRTHTMDSPCEVKLTPSSLDRNCLLLILKGEKDPDKLLNTLQKSHLEKFGIESLKKENLRSHRDTSQRTLIALVTSGLLLAFLGLAGYFLMRRRSWSPAGERLQSELIQQEPSRATETL